MDLVDVDQLAGMPPLVASHRLGRLRRAGPVESCVRLAEFGLAVNEIVKSGPADPRCP